MATMKGMTVLMGMLAACPAWGQESGAPDPATSGFSSRHGYSSRLAIGEESRGATPAGAGTLSIRAYNPLWLPDNRQAPFLDRWPEMADVGAEGITVGYTWNRLRFESSSVSTKKQAYAGARNRYYQRDSVSRRLIYSPGANWTLQLSRGHLSNLDQLEPERKIQRTTFAATYHHAFGGNNWQTTLAWGRNGGEMRESTMGYLIESTFSLRSAHAFFGRMEQVGSDDLLRENEALQRQTFKMNKVTLGYFYNAGNTGPVKYDVGALVTRHLVPGEMSRSYGDNPTTYLMFMRFRFQ